MCVHYTNGSNPLTIKKQVEKANKLLLEDKITISSYENMKRSILSYIVLSHKAVVANWFVV